MLENGTDTAVAADELDLGEHVREQLWQEFRGEERAVDCPQLGARDVGLVLPFIPSFSAFQLRDDSIVGVLACANHQYRQAGVA